MQEQTSEVLIVKVVDDRTATSVEALERAILDNLYIAARTSQDAKEADWFTAVAYTVRDRILARWLEIKNTYVSSDVRVVACLSAEFLVGPHLANNLLNCDLENQ
jgi:glycogen phosphorylase